MALLSSLTLSMMNTKKKPGTGSQQSVTGGPSLATVVAAPPQVVTGIAAPGLSAPAAVSSKESRGVGPLRDAGVSSSSAPATVAAAPAPAAPTAAAVAPPTAPAAPREPKKAIGNLLGYSDSEDSDDDSAAGLSGDAAKRRGQAESEPVSQQSSVVKPAGPNAAKDSSDAGAPPGQLATGAKRDPEPAAEVGTVRKAKVMAKTAQTTKQVPAVTLLEPRIPPPVEDQARLADIDGEPLSAADLDGEELSAAELKLIAHKCGPQNWKWRVRELRPAARGLAVGSVKTVALLQQAAAAAEAASSVAKPSASTAVEPESVAKPEPEEDPDFEDFAFLAAIDAQPKAADTVEVPAASDMELLRKQIQGAPPPPPDPPPPAATVSSCEEPPPPPPTAAPGPPPDQALPPRPNEVGGSSCSSASPLSFATSEASKVKDEERSRQLALRVLEERRAAERAEDDRKEALRAEERKKAEEKKRAEEGRRNAERRAAEERREAESRRRLEEEKRKALETKRSIEEVLRQRSEAERKREDEALEERSKHIFEKQRLEELQDLHAAEQRRLAEHAAAQRQVAEGTRKAPADAGNEKRKRAELQWVSEAASAESEERQKRAKTISIKMPTLPAGSSSTTAEGGGKTSTLAELLRGGPASSCDGGGGCVAATTSSAAAVPGTAAPVKPVGWLPAGRRRA